MVMCFILYSIPFDKIKIFKMWEFYIEKIYVLCFVFFSKLRIFRFLFYKNKLFFFLKLET